MTMGIAIMSSPSLSFAEPAFRVAVSLPPQKYFVERIGGDLVDVTVMVEPGANPHTYEPKPRQMAAISGVEAFLTMGIAFEKKWMDRFKSANPNMQIIRMEAGVKKIPMKTHLHEPQKGGHEAHHSTLDPHIWLSPPNVTAMAKNIKDGLSALDPGNKVAYESGYRQFKSELLELHRVLSGIFSAWKGKEFMVFHPSWGYFAKAYGLVQIPVQIEGKEPKPAELMHLIKHGRKQGIKVIFLQPQLSSTGAEMIAGEINGRVVFIDPLAENWMKNLKQAAMQLEGALK